MKTKAIWTIIIFSLFLFSRAAFASTDTLQLKVTGKSIPIYEKPKVSGKILANAPEGQILDIKEKTGKWYKVLMPGTDSQPPITGFVFQKDVEEIPADETGKPKPKKKDHFFIMGMGMLRLNWAGVEGNEFRFRYSDLGLPTDFSTRERASFMVDGTFGHGEYSINGHVNYDAENRITEPPLEFLVNVGNENTYLSVGDYYNGVLMDSIFARYYHPFRGGILGFRAKRFGAEVIGGLSRGESAVEEISANSGTGPYYLPDSPIIRGSEVIYLVVRNANNPDMEIKRSIMVRNRDYFIDYDRGALLFANPIYPYDELGNPVVILASYQFESLIGRFSRAVMGFRAYLYPLKPVKLTFSYIADADKDQPLGDIFKHNRGIYSFGLNVDTKRLSMFGEFAFSSEEAVKKQYAIFGGGILNFSKSLKLLFNAWDVDEDFPGFANRQLQYGYSLFQVFPSYADRSIFLSPFQFTRNLGAELYPFTLARVSIDENEGHGFLEWEKKVDRVSMGYGFRNEMTTDLKTDTFYVSTFHNGERTKGWGKFGLEWGYDPEKADRNTRVDDVLLGVRQRVKKYSHGEVYVQADYKSDRFTDFLDIAADTFHKTYSVSAEYLTGSEGFFAGYRKEILDSRETGLRLLDADIFEAGVRRHVYKGLFTDCRYRVEESSSQLGDMNNKILSLGVGIETKKIRAMAQYEIQVNRQDDNEGRRQLYSFYFFGEPLKRMSISFRYYKQLGKENVPLSINERSEEQLTFRFLWRPWNWLNVYSQWRYDTNLELYPPLDRTRSNSLAEVHGLKLTISKRFEFLANYKLIKVWGPIDNRKYSTAAELGYLIFRHFRIGVGGEIIDFDDPLNPDSKYRSTVGYFKLVVLY